jgi:uncharacterized protein YceK
MRVRSAVIMLFTALALSGCSTMASLSMDDPANGGKQPYGGTAHCVDSMRHTLLDEDFVAIPDSRVVCLAFQTCDLPLSLVADTVVLPYTLTRSIQPSAETRPNQEASGKTRQGNDPSQPAKLSVQERFVRRDDD